MQKNFLVIEAGDSKKIHLASDTEIACAVTVDFDNFDGFGILLNVPQETLEYDSKDIVSNAVLPAVGGAIMRAIDQWKEQKGLVLWEQFKRGEHSV